MFDSKIVVEIEVVDGSDGKWYRKGLDMRGKEVWEECEDDEENYSDDWIDDIIKERKESGE